MENNSNTDDSSKELRDRLERLEKVEIIDLICGFYKMTDLEATNGENANTNLFMVNEFAGVKRTLLNRLIIMVNHSVFNKYGN